MKRRVPLFCKPCCRALQHDRGTPRRTSTNRGTECRVRLNRAVCVRMVAA